MGFRDELGATKARTEALQRRVTELEEENRALESLVNEAQASTPREAYEGEGDRRLARAGLFLALFVGVAGALRFGQPRIAFVLLVVVALAAAARSFIETVPPGFLLVLRGRRYRDERGELAHYRIVHEGRVLRAPMIEHADRLDVRARAIHLDVQGAHCKGNTQVDLKLGAVIRVARDGLPMHHAIERFLGREMEEVDEVARQTLVGALRSAIVALTVTQLEREPERLAEALVAQRIDEDFAKLGIVLENLILPPEVTRRQKQSGR